jgi:hypothetical protein
VCVKSLIRKSECCRCKCLVAGKSAVDMIWFEGALFRRAMKEGSDVRGVGIRERERIFVVNSRV